MPYDMRRRRTKQLDLFAQARPKRRLGGGGGGGRGLGPGRVPPGRKPLERRIGFMPHRARPTHDHRHPVHVTIRRVRLAPSFRAQRVYRVILAELLRAKRKGVRVIHHSVQPDHLHLMIEGNDSPHLSAQMRNLFSRIAMMINGALGRHGRVFADRHHRRELETPTETRNALVYILFNSRKHEAQREAPRGGLTPADFAWLDEKSSAPWFDGWHEAARPPPDLIARCRADTPDEPPVVEPKTWLARIGWHRGGGPIRFDAVPRSQ